MKQSVVQGYTVLDNCFKYTNSDSTIDCYMFTRQALQNTPRADRRRRSCAGNRSVSEDAEHRTALSA